MSNENSFDNSDNKKLTEKPFQKGWQNFIGGMKDGFDKFYFVIDLGPKFISNSMYFFLVFYMWISAINLPFQNCRSLQQIRKISRHLKLQISDIFQGCCTPLIISI